MVEPRADHAEGDAPDRDADDEIGVAALLASSGRVVSQTQSEDRDEQRQPVEVDRERPERGRPRSTAKG